MIHPKHRGRYVQGPWPKYFSGVRRGYVLLTPCKTPITLPMGCVEEGEYYQVLVMCELTGECEWMDERTLVDVPSRAAWEQQQEASSSSLDAKPGTWESAKAGTWDGAAWTGQQNPQPFFPLDKAEVSTQMPVRKFEMYGHGHDGGPLYIKPNGVLTKFPTEREELEAQVATARAEANDLMQRLTESQQEVAKLGLESRSHQVRVSELEYDNKHLDNRLGEATRELAEVKAGRDRLHEEACALRAENESHKASFRKVVIRNERLEGIVKLIRSSLACE